VKDPAVEAHETPTEADPRGGDAAVGAGSSFEGLFAFWGRARIDGRVSGEVVADGTLEVGPAAVVRARIAVDALIVEGVVEGEVVARDRVEVRDGGRIGAEVRTPRLVLDEGGRLDGRLVMTPKAPAEGASRNAASAA
jgi:cytoskeletal protein CcmA (bactofilin family)